MYLEENAENRQVKFENDLSISIDLHAESSEILKYGLKVIPNFNNYFGNRLDYHAFVDSYYGKFEFGSPLDATENLRVGADSIVVGSSAVNGSIFRHLSVRNDNIGSFLFGPGTLMNQNFGCHESELEGKYWNDSRYLSKINYYSPNIYGLQLGLSLTPNVSLTEKNLHLVLNNNFNFPLGLFFGVALNYIETLWDIGISLSVVHESNGNNLVNKFNGDREEATVSFKSNDFGIAISYFGLTLAGSYGINSSKKLSPQPIGTMVDSKKNGEYQTYGGAYEFGPFSASITRFESKLEENKFGSTNYGVRMNFAKGLAVYLEYVDYYYSHGPSNSPNYVGERGYGVFTGILISF
jgi:hypothetical protein